jgi:hypothetical protein
MTAGEASDRDRQQKEAARCPSTRRRSLPDHERAAGLQAASGVTDEEAQSLFSVYQQWYSIRLKER